MKKTAFGVLLLLLNPSIFQAQTNNDKPDRQQIVKYTEEVNKLILHINSNIVALKSYQQKLNLWAENGNSSLADLPVFRFTPFAHHQVFEKINEADGKSIYGNDFNYKSAAVKLYRQSLLFNQFCMQVEKLTPTSGKQAFYNQQVINLKQIDNLSDEWVELCYSFSLSASINFGKETLPYHLEIIKNLVAQSKNIIMAMRDNNPTQVKSYLTKFNGLVYDLTKMKVTDIHKVGKYTITEESLGKQIQSIIDQSYEIGAWTEQYLQTSLDEKETAPIIFETIKAFNGLNDVKGIAAIYNYINSYTPSPVLKFTEEPLQFEAIVSKKVKENIAVKTVVELKPEVKMPEPEILKEPVIVEKVPEFDKNNQNTLAGSLPANIVFLMDVSPSMKKDNKLATLQNTILHYANLMRPEDRISLIAFSGKAKVLLQGGTRNELNDIKTIVNALFSSGGTDIENGFIYAYELAKQTYMPKGNNRVILATDGEFGMRKKVYDFIEEKAEKDKIYLSVFHLNNVVIPSERARLEEMVKIGKGNYQFISSGQQAIKALISEIKIKGD